MPVNLKHPVADAAIIAAIYEWVNLLAEEKYQEAFDFTLHSNHNDWTPGQLESVINGYGVVYDHQLPKSVVTKPDTAVNDSSKYYKEFTYFEHPRPHPNPDFEVIGHILFDLPINGKWSDLTASFQLLSTAIFITIELDDIHVF